jgi:hypothetical protein
MQWTLRRQIAAKGDSINFITVISESQPKLPFYCFLKDDRNLHIDIISSNYVIAYGKALFCFIYYLTDSSLCHLRHGSQLSADRMAINLQVGRPKNLGSIFVGIRYIFPSTSYPISTTASFPGWRRRSVKLTIHLQLVPRQRTVELYLHTPYIFIAWCLIKYRHNSTFSCHQEL